MKSFKKPRVRDKLKEKMYYEKRKREGKLNTKQTLSSMRSKLKPGDVFITGNLRHPPKTAFRRYLRRELELDA